VDVGPDHEQRHEPREPPERELARVAVGEQPGGERERREGEHVRADVEVRRGRSHPQPDEYGNRDRVKPGAREPHGEPRERRREGRDRPEQLRVEPAGPVGQRHRDLAEPLVRHPPRPRERERVRVGPDEAFLQDDLAGRRVPERAGVAHHPDAPARE
jgi:hypothetical protein